jgi:hypothetical protein
MHSAEAAAAELLWFSVAYLVLSVLFLFNARTTIARAFARRRHRRASRPGYTEA